MSKITVYGDVEGKRSAEMPVQRQLEMIWRALDQISRGEPLSDDVVDMLDRVMALAKKYPFPPPGQP